MALFIVFTDGFGATPGLPRTPPVGGPLDGGDRVPKPRRSGLLHSPPDGRQRRQCGDTRLRHRYREVRTGWSDGTIVRRASPGSRSGRVRGRHHDAANDDAKGNPDVDLRGNTGAPASTWRAFSAGGT